MKILVLEVSNNLVKVCRAKKRFGKTIIEDLSLLGFDNGVSALNLKEINSSQGKVDRLIISLPRRSFMIKFLKLPSESRQEIAGMLEFQLAKIVPYSLDEVLYDFTFIPAGQGYSCVVIYLIQKKKIDSVLEFIKTVDPLKVSITLNSFGVLNWFLYKNHKGNFFVNDVDVANADFCAIVDKRLAFSRSFEYKSFEEFNLGFKDTLGIFKKELPVDIALDSVFFGIKNHIVNYPEINSSYMPIEAGPKLCFSAPANKAIGLNDCSWVSLLGLALSSDSLQFELTRDFLKPARKNASFKKRWVNLAIIVFQIVMLAGVFGAKYYYSRRAYTKFLTTELKKIKVGDKVGISPQQLNLLNRGSRYQLSRRWLEVIDLLPQETMLELIDFSQNGDFTLRGYTSQINQVFKLAASLKSLKGFKSVKVDYASRAKQKGVERVEFRISGKSR